MLASLEQFRKRQPARSLVLEIHGSAVADLSTVQGLRKHLERLNIGIVLDDFGTGRARLLELTDLLPQFIKFNYAWIKDLHRATQRRLEMVEVLADLVKDMDIATVAEGIECQEEADACLKVGFEYAKGYHFGQPSPALVFSDLEKTAKLRLEDFNH